MKNDENLPHAPDHSSGVINAELLALGEGEVGYVRELARTELEDLPIDLDMERAWGVFSATGETLALCDSPLSAGSFFTDHGLMKVSLH